MSRRQVHRSLLFGVASLALIWVAYVLYVTNWVPGELREAAARSGLELELGSVRSLYPGELRVRDVELAAPAIGAVVTAERVVVDPGWRSLFSPASGNEARVSGLALRWASGSLGPLDARWRGLATSGRASSEATVALEGDGVRWQTAAHAATMTVRGYVELRYHQLEPDGTARAIFEDASIEASRIVLVGASRATVAAAAGDHHFGIRANLHLENATFDAERGFEAAGTMSVRGDDAGVVLDLLGARESVRWMLSALVGQSFEVASSLRTCRSGAALDGLRFESGLTRASGALRAAADGWSGALQVRRGSLSIGISITPGGVETLLAPQPFWLDTELALIRDVCVRGGF